MHISIPGREDEDQTPFSLTKRKAEHVIAAGPVPFVILRPGFVAAPAAYGGSALVRALAALPLDLPARDAVTLFSTTDVIDISRTIAIVAKRWLDGEKHWKIIWDVMARPPMTLGEVMETFRHRLGGPSKRLPMPSWMMDLGAKAGDLVARLAGHLQSEAPRSVRCDAVSKATPAPGSRPPASSPRPLAATLQTLSAGVQEKWFARLYLIKPLVIAALAVFWSVSGFIALTVAFDAATTILTSHGFSLRPAQAITVVSSLTDIGIGLAIAIRKTCRAGLVAGIAVSLFYMAGAAVITPEMWIEPLGALVKTVPAIVLMLVALAILEDR